MSDSAAPAARMPDPPTPDTILQMLESQIVPGVHRLIDLIVNEAQALNLPIYLVGGFVRDLILKRPSLDLDFTIVGLAPDLARALADHLGGEITIHPAFLTATWTPDATLRESLDLPLVDGQPLTVDLVTARREKYAYPGALPTVERGTLADDLFRRDFTINAMAIKLPEYEWIDQHGGFDDLRAGFLRVLHERSFEDDPTRIMRGIRFEGRYRIYFSDYEDSYIYDLVDPPSPVFTTVNGDRWRNEFELMFAEPEPIPCLVTLDFYGALLYITEGISVEGNLPLLAVLENLHNLYLRHMFNWFNMPAFTEAMWVTLIWASAFRDKLIGRLKLTPTAVIGSKAVERGLSFLTNEPHPKPSTFVHAIEPIDLPACAALWAIVPDNQRPLVERYVREWRHVRPITTGEDLKARGLRPGPVFGTLLKQLRDAWLDGEVQTPEAEQALLDRLIANLPAVADGNQSTDQHSLNNSEKRR